MPSVALELWSKERAARLRQLYDAHAAVGGTGRGRRTATGQLNMALVAHIAAEFQGFGRDLHNEAVSVVVRSVGATTVPLQTVVSGSFTLNRALDSKNAQPGSLGQDFGRLGISLWTALGQRYPKKTTDWNESLETLNVARNGIAHNDPSKLAIVKARGYPMTLHSVRRWHRSLNGLCAAMDAVLARHLAALTGGRAPW